MRRNSRLTFFGFLLFVFSLSGQTYREIKGWEEPVNARLESFLNSTLAIKDRKVAVFDCDGTLFGQAPYYLADEAIYSYAKVHYAQKPDSLSVSKMAVIDSLLGGSNVGIEYVQRRIAFLSGLSTEEVEQIGEHCFREKYNMKFYPEMRELLANLEEYGFEIWVLTASPEILYQKFVHENLGIPENRILGVKSVISEGIVTEQLVYPVPQDGGKAQAIQTLIKARPLLVAGNSRGDLEMMNESAGLKIIVNPDNEKIQVGPHAGKMEGYTVKQYWEENNALAVYCKDFTESGDPFVAQEMELKPNKSHPKSSEVVR